MSQTWGIHGVATDYDPEDQGRTWANFHNEGAALVSGALGLDCMGGEITGRQLLALVVRARMKPGVTPGGDIARRLDQLLTLAQNAGDLGRIWWG